MMGRYFVTPSVAAKISHRQSPNDVSLDALGALTPRQREVLQLLAEGNSAKEIAADLFISRRTVEYHKYRIMDLLGFQKSAELIQFAVQTGLFHTRD
jgi:DNA-binding NarL/FixJ family response regulator